MMPSDIKGKIWEDMYIRVLDQEMGVCDSDHTATITHNDDTD